MIVPIRRRVKKIRVKCCKIPYKVAMALLLFKMKLNKSAASHVSLLTAHYLRLISFNNKGTELKN